MNLFNKLFGLGKRPAVAFGLLAALVVIIGLIHYPQQVFNLDRSSIFYFLGFTSHIPERVLLLLPIVYAGFVFGLRGGIITIIASAAIMLPRTILFPQSPADDWFETCGIIVAGLSATYWTDYYHRSTAQLKDAHEMLGKIISASPIATFAIDSQHRVTQWNRAMEMLTQIKREEMIGTDNQWRPFYPSKTPVMADLIVSGASFEEMNRQYRAPRRKSVLVEGAYESEDYFAGAGKGRWLNYTASPIYDNSGRVVGAIETLQDITERKEAEEAIQKSERRFRDLFENALDPIWLQDLDGNMMLANQAAARITGLTTEELVNKNVKEFLTPGSLKTAREVRRRLLEGNSVEGPYDLHIINVHGNEAIFTIKSNLIFVDGKPAGVQNIARDVTREKRMAENMQYYLHLITRAQEDERKRVARELHDSTAQNLIALLHRLEPILRGKQMLPEQSADLQIVYEQIRGILQEIRTFSRELRPSILDDLGLVPALEWVAEQVKNEYGVDTDINVQQDKRRRLSNETELLLFRIVQEALRNVGKHANADRATVSVEFAEKNVKVTINDNGSGFELPENIIELSQSGKLGLIGLQERVELLNGTWNIYSGPGKGTTIIVEAPV